MTRRFGKNSMTAAGRIVSEFLGRQVAVLRLHTGNSRGWVEEPRRWTIARRQIGPASRGSSSTLRRIRGSVHEPLDNGAGVCVLRMNRTRPTLGVNAVVSAPIW